MLDQSSNGIVTKYHVKFKILHFFGRSTRFRQWLLGALAFCLRPGPLPCYAIRMGRDALGIPKLAIFIGGFRWYKHDINQQFIWGGLWSDQQYDTCCFLMLFGESTCVCTEKNVAFVLFFKSGTWECWGWETIKIIKWLKTMTSGISATWAMNQHEPTTPWENMMTVASKNSWPDIQNDQLMARITLRMASWWTWKTTCRRMRVLVMVSAALTLCLGAQRPHLDC